MYKSEKFWDRLAKKFDKPENSIEPSHVKTIEKIKKYLSKSDMVLDFGCAAGSITMDIAKYVKESHGIDISSKMIEAAKNRANERNLKSVTFTQSSIFDVHYQPETFNVILAYNVLHLLEEPQIVINRINKLLKPGGCFISLTVCMGDKKTFLTHLFTFLTKLKIVPEIKFIKIEALKESIISEHFQIIELEKVVQGTISYFIVAKKI